MAVIFKKQASTVQNWNKKRGENLLFWRSHSCVDRDLKKNKVFTLFSSQRAARGFNSFSKSGPSCEIIAHPWLRGNAADGDCRQAIRY